MWSFFSGSSCATNKYKSAERAYTSFTTSVQKLNTSRIEIYIVQLHSVLSPSKNLTPLSSARQPPRRAGSKMDLIVPWTQRAGYFFCNFKNVYKEILLTQSLEIYFNILLITIFKNLLYYTDSKVKMFLYIFIHLFYYGLIILMSLYLTVIL